MHVIVHGYVTFCHVEVPLRHRLLLQCRESVSEARVLRQHIRELGLGSGFGAISETCVLRQHTITSSRSQQGLGFRVEVWGPLVLQCGEAISETRDLRHHTLTRHLVCRVQERLGFGAVSETPVLRHHTPMSCRSLQAISETWVCLKMRPRPAVLLRGYLLSFRDLHLQPICTVAALPTAHDE